VFGCIAGGFVRADGKAAAAARERRGIANSLHNRRGYGFVPRVSKVVRGVRWVGAVVLWLGMATESARALDLAWSAPAECASSATQRGRIEQLLAREGASRAALRVRGRVTRLAKQRYRLWLQIGTRVHRAERTVSLVDCEAVEQTTLALIALALSPTERPTVGGPRGAATRAGTSGQGSRRRKVGSPAARSTRLDARGVARTELAASDPEAARHVDAGERLEGEQRVTGEAQQGASEPSTPAPAAAGRDVEPPRADAPRDAPGDSRSAAPATAEPASPSREGASASSAQAAATAPATSEVARAPARWWARASLFAGAANMGLPRTQLDTGLRVGLARGASYGELRADGLWPRSEQVEGGGAGRVRIRSQALGIAGCAAWGARLRAGPCARVSLLRSVGEVSRITAPRGEQPLLWCAATLSALLGLRVYEGLELSLEAGVSAPLSARPRYTVEGRGSVQTARLWSMHAVLGLGFRWEQKRPGTSRNQPAASIGR
jgi:hypothetical protein